jgi:hypothetical protein
MMMDRCTNRNGQNWADYGGRGITVCERWLIFENFLADMGERPPGTTIERVENDLGYEPGNCRWATRKQQSRNRRSTVLTQRDVDEIRRRGDAGEKQKILAIEFKVSRGYVNKIVLRKKWV